MSQQDGRLKPIIRALYESHEPVAVRFRYVLVVFDLASIAYFIATTPIPPGTITTALDILIAIVIALDLFARAWIAEDRASFFKKLYVLADIAVLLSLVIDPFVAFNLTFLRILRGLRIMHSYHLLRDLRHQSAFFRRNETAVLAATNLLVFVFFTTAIVFAFTFQEGDGFDAYVNSLYFTVTTLTTTGYGDITPTGSWGKLGAVAIMVIGVTLFVNLARAIFVPSKVAYACPRCGLQKHEPDAIHCKHCGQEIAIETDGG